MDNKSWAVASDDVEVDTLFFSKNSRDSFQIFICRICALKARVTKETFVLFVSIIPRTRTDRNVRIYVRRI